MKDFDIAALAATACAFLGPWIWVLLFLAALWLAAVFIASRRGEGNARACRAAAYVALFAGTAAVALLPEATHSGFAHIRGALDWIVLLAMGGAIGLALGLFAWPFLRLALRR